jgi:hypothetical protein
MFIDCVGLHYWVVSFMEHLDDFNHRRYNSFVVYFTPRSNDFICEYEKV